MTINSVAAADAPKGDQGQHHLVAGEAVSLRLWKDEAPNDDKAMHAHAYEVVGYAISGRATLHLGPEGSVETLELTPGVSWQVPSNVPHTYTIHEPFTAVEAVSPSGAAR